MGLKQQPEFLQLGHNAADRRRAEAEARLVRDRFGPDRLCGEDIIFHDRSKYPSHPARHKKIHRLPEPPPSKKLLKI
jgi:hypothetical protein